MIDVLVFSALAAALALTTAWALSPRLRRWIEQPKYAFQHKLLEFEKANSGKGGAHERR